MNHPFMKYMPKHTVRRLSALLLAVAVFAGLLPAGLAENPNGTSNTVQFGAPRAASIPLESVATMAVESISSDNTEVEPDGTVERDQQIGINVSFTITDLDTARATPRWTYDVSGCVGADQIFSGLVANSNGRLVDNSTGGTAGKYTVTADGLVTLEPNPEWLALQSSGVRGTFTLNAQLNETVNRELDENTFRFPGGASGTVTFLRKDIRADKYLKHLDSEKDEEALAHACAYDLTAGTSVRNTDDAGSVEVFDAGDGSYRLFYKIKLWLNVKPGETLKVEDTLTGGQDLMPDTLKIYTVQSATAVNNIRTSANGVNFLTTSDGGFTLDLKAALEATFGDNTAKYLGRDIFIEYYTYLDKNDLNIEQGNSAKVTYDHRVVTPSTTVTPTYDDDLGAYKWMSGDPEINSHVTGSGDPDAGGNQVPVSATDGVYTVYFLTGGTLTSPATALYVTDTPTGVDVIPSSFRLSIGLKNQAYRGYEWYRDDLVNSNALTVNANGSFEFNAYKFIQYLVEDKKTNSAGESYSDLYAGCFHYDATTGDFTLKPDMTFKLCYGATVKEGYRPIDANPQPVSNSATWTTDYTTDTGSVSGVLLPDPGTPTIDKEGWKSLLAPTPTPLHRADGTVDSADAGEWVRYSLKVANKGLNGRNMDLAHGVVTDTITNFIAAVPEVINIYSSDGSLYASYNTTSKSWTAGADKGLTMRVVNDGLPGGWSANVGVRAAYDAAGGSIRAVSAMQQTYKLFELTFGDGPYEDEYTITYEVLVDKEMPDTDDIYGSHPVKNSGSVGIIGSGTADTTYNHNLWYSFPTARKEFVEWDKENNTAVWDVYVGLGGLAKISRPVEVIEFNYSAQAGPTSGGMTAVSPAVYTFEVYDEAGNRLDPADSEDAAQADEYIVKNLENDPNYPRREVVFPKGITQPKRVRVYMKLADDLSAQLEYHAKNTAYVQVDENKTPGAATADYYDDTFGFSKNGKFSRTDAGKAVIDWSIELNPQGKALKNDFKPVIRDTLPEGVYIEGQVVITGRLKANVSKAFVIRVDAQRWSGDFELNIIDLINANWNDSAHASINNPYAYEKPTGLSEWHFTVDYHTVFTGAALEDIQAVMDSGTLKAVEFTNVSEVYKEGGSAPLDTADSSVPFEYENLVKKHDRSGNANDPIEVLIYEIEINPEKKMINGGDWVLLSDEIPSTMDLLPDSIQVKSLQSDAVTPRYTVSYTESASGRLLEVSVTDQTSAVVYFEALPTAGNTAYVNTAVLSGKQFRQASTVNQDRKVSSGGSMTGISDGVQLKKIDRYEPSKSLGGAEFQLYTCAVDADGKITAETATGAPKATAERTGVLSFAPLVSGTVYAWQETAAPEDYVITSSAPRYFTIYPKLTFSNRITVPWNDLSQATRNAIQAKFSAANYPNSYVLVRSLGDDSTTPVYVAASGPSGAQETAEYYTAECCWLTSREYPSGTGYDSLLDEVNAVCQAKADALAARVNAYYSDPNKVESVACGFTWRVENVSDDMATVDLSVSKKLLGRDAEAGEFSFCLYDDNVPGSPRLLQTKSGAAAADGAVQSVAFDPLSFSHVGTYQYYILETPATADKMAYDPAVYHITVTAEETGSGESLTLEARVTGVTKTVGDSTADVSFDPAAPLPALPFVNTYGDLGLTGTKVWVDGGKTHDNSAEVKLTVRSKVKGSDGDGAPLDPQPSVTWRSDTYTYSNLEKYDSQGRELEYWVVETPVEGYADPEYADADGKPATKGVSGGTVTNRLSGETTLSGTKTWVDGGKAHDNAKEVALTLSRVSAKDGAAEETVEVRDPLTLAWTGNAFKYEHLPKYDAEGYEYTYSVAETGYPEGYVPSRSGNDLVNTLAGETELSGAKTWVDGGKTHDNAKEIALTLSRVSAKEGAAEETVEVKDPLTLSWTGNTFQYEHLPKYDAEGYEYTYSVSETGYPEGYVPSRSGSDLVNTLTGETELSGTKTWVDGGKTHDNPKEVTLTLSRVSAKDGAAEETVEIMDPLTLAWTGNAFKFEHLPKYDPEGYEYTYSVAETGYPEGYTPSRSGNGLVNTLSGETGFSGAKVWADGGETHDNAKEVALTLSRVSAKEGAAEETVEVADPVTLSWTGNTFTYEHLPKYDAEGYEYTYSAVETPAEGYEAPAYTDADGKAADRLPDGGTVTNTKEAEKTGSLKIRKSVTVNGEPTDTTLADGAYTFTVTGAGAAAGTVCRVTITISGGGFKEASIDGRTAVPGADGYIVVPDLPAGEYTVAEDETGLAEKGVSIAKAPAGPLTVVAGETAEIPAADFVNNIDSATVKVKKVDIAGGEELEGAHIQIIDKNGNPVDEWDSTKEAHETAGLKPGEEYILRETVAPHGYAVATDTAFSVDKAGKVTSTGSVTEDGILLVEDAMLTVSAAVRKVWNDDGNRDGVRPVSLAVNLLADGVKVKTVTLTAENGWTAVERGLPMVNKDLKDITYTWEETAPGSGYRLTSTSTRGVLTTLTNTYTPEKTSVSVRKAWNDGDNAAGVRPASVRVQLFADGVAAGEPVALSAAGGWTHTWENLDKYTNPKGTAGGQKAIAYTVEELEIPEGYRSETAGSAAAGFVITNTLERGKLVIEKAFDIPGPAPEEAEEEETTEFTVVKAWNDDNDRDGIRPDSVTVHLYAGGSEVASARLTAAGGWQHTFTDLPKWSRGQEIRYSVTEDPVEGYSCELHGHTVRNTHRPEETSVSVRKVWDDKNNKAGLRPSSVRVTLSDGTHVLLSAANGWQATVSGLPKYENGQEIVYTWTEQEVVGYRQTGMTTDSSLTIITNAPKGLPKIPDGYRTPRTPGGEFAVFEEYRTALGVELIINHVGDCFD